MSKVSPKVCPLISRSVTYRTYWPDKEIYDKEEQLIEAPCLQERCAWWNHNEAECIVKHGILLADWFVERIRSHHPDVDD